MRTSAIFRGLTLAAALLASGFAAEAANSKLPPGAKLMAPAAVREIYSGKTWKWQAGGGYFAANKKFHAVSGAGKKLTVAKGRWLVTKSGRLCFVADWTDRRATYRNTKTCFSHATHGGRIYQSKDLSGQWYVFKNNPAKRGDEIRKFRSGDTIAGAYAVAKKKLKAK